nr:60S ribosomal protein L35A [Cryptomonas sp.]
MSQVRILIPINKKQKSIKSYIGKRIFYSLKNNPSDKKDIRWGKIVSQHGKTGVFLAKFKKQIPPSMVTSSVFITFLPYIYPKKT